MTTPLPLTAAAVLILLAALPLALSACGGGGNSTSTQARPNSSVRSARSMSDRFGAEATASEAQPIEVAFHAYLAALAAGEWNRACSHLTAGARHRKASVAELIHAKTQSCVGNVQANTAALSSNRTHSPHQG